MSYYDTIDDDLKRAKAILKNGEGSGCTEYRPDHNGECQTCDEPADAHGDVSTAIMGADIYAAYKLLESFVAEITLFHGLFSDYEDPCGSYEQAFAIWQMMKARETRLHDEIARLRTVVQTDEATISHNLATIERLSAEHLELLADLAAALASLAELRPELVELRAEVEARGRIIELYERQLAERDAEVRQLRAHGQSPDR